MCESALSNVMGPFCAAGRVMGIFALKLVADFWAEVLVDEVADDCAAIGVHKRHTLLLPSLLHTYRALGVSKKAPTFVHALPILGGVGAAKLGVPARTPVRREETMTSRIALRIVKLWQDSNPEGSFGR